jgi:hypothetical protein
VITFAEERVKCEKEFDEWLKKSTRWIELQKEMLETKPTPEKIEEATRLYGEIIKKAKEFAACEVKA